MDAASGISPGRRFLASLGWIIVAVLAVAFYEVALGFLVGTLILPAIPLESMSDAQLMIVGWVYIVAWNFGAPLFLLFATDRAPRLNRAMVWVIVALNTLKLLTAPVALSGGRPAGGYSFFAYDFKGAGGLTLTAATAVGAICSLGGVAVFVWLKRRNRRQHDVEQALQPDKARCEVT